MRTQIRALALALAATALTAGAANAAIELQSYSFTATTPGPITSHSGSFVLAYDDVASTYALDSIDFRLDSFVFNSLNSGAVAPFTDAFAVGGTYEDGVTSMLGAGYDFVFLSQLQNKINSLLYKTPTDTSYHIANSVTLTRIDVPTPGAVPEPTTWALMILGFGAAGAALRRRRFAIA